MRIGMLCPYSLTLPGGVQVQVLGLARAVRRQGHDVRVLAPCDGPPPEVGVIPLGQSVPAAANGSVAPLAPDPSAQLRTIRALRDITAAGDPPAVYNFLQAGGASYLRWGTTPISIAAPPVLVSELALLKSESSEKPPVLPHPFFTRN